MMLADIWPAEMVIVVGTDIARLELATRTCKPPAGARPEISTVALVDPPPVMDV